MIGLVNSISAVRHVETVSTKLDYCSHDSQGYNANLVTIQLKQDTKDFDLQRVTTGMKYEGYIFMVDQIKWGLKHQTLLHCFL